MAAAAAAAAVSCINFNAREPTDARHSATRDLLRSPALAGINPEDLMDSGGLDDYRTITVAQF